MAITYKNDVKVICFKASDIDSVFINESYMVCQRIGFNAWQIVQSDRTEEIARRSCGILWQHDYRNNRLSDYRVFHDDYIKKMREYTHNRYNELTKSLKNDALLSIFDEYLINNNISNAEKIYSLMSFDLDDEDSIERFVLTIGISLRIPSKYGLRKFILTNE